MQAGYADASGQRNTLDHMWHFTTERAPGLSSTDPSDSATGVAPDRNIVLTFSRPMRADSMPSAVQLTPVTPFLLLARPGADVSQFEIVPTRVLHATQSHNVS